MTRDGRKIRIICTDAKTPYPVIALVESTDGTTEQLLSFIKNGKYFDNRSNAEDLFFAPEKHEGWVNVFRDGSGSGYKYAVIFNSGQEARNDVVENERCGYITTTKIEWEE